MHDPRPETEETGEARWRESRRALRAWFLGQLRDPELAEDLTQEVFLKALDRLDTLRDLSRFDAWLWSIARRTLIDAARSRSRARRTLTPIQEEVHAAPEPALEERARRALAACLPALIETLPEPCRGALRATHVEGLTQRELAEREGLSHSGAKSRVQRGRHLLRGVIEACCALDRDHAGQITGVALRDAPCDACDPET